MKTKITTMLALAIAMQTMAQQVPTISNPPNGGQNNGDYWSRAGNLGTGANNQNNLFGTKWNSPIYTVTGNNFNAQSYRMKVNGIFASAFTQYTIGGYGWNQGVNSTGYVLMGTNKTSGTSPLIYNDKGAFSLLHLNGRNGSFVQEGGYRPWMQTGVTLTDNQDLSYMGLRKVGTGFDITETVIGWADNAGSSSGPDCVAFRFFGAGDGVTTINTNLQSVNDLDGLHVAQFAPTGEFGLGNTFGVNTTGTPANLYVRPASLAHYSLSNMRSVWQQYTNRNITTGSGTGETNADGLRVGIVGHNNQNINGSAMVYNQENRPLLFSTNANTNTANLANGQSQERMRIMSISTHIQGGNYGIYNPGSLSGNLTRVAISHNPSAPVTRPLSLLHLGYNTSSNFLGSPQVDGWRPWMDVGMFISENSDNVYLIKLSLT